MNLNLVKNLYKTLQFNLNLKSSPNSFKQLWYGIDITTDFIKTLKEIYFIWDQINMLPTTKTKFNPNHDLLIMPTTYYASSHNVTRHNKDATYQIIHMPMFKSL